MIILVMKSVVKLRVFFVETPISVLLPYQPTDLLTDHANNIF